MVVKIKALILIAILCSQAAAEDELELLNKQRNHHNLYSLIEDLELTALAHERLEANIKRGKWDHNKVNGRMIGKFRPAKVEGCGNVTTDQKWFTCFWKTKKFSHAGAAMAKVKGRYWQLLLLR